MKCPICQEPVKIDDPEMPFCSERCRDIDLGNWATEKYVISTPLQSSDDPASQIKKETGEDDD